VPFVKFVNEALMSQITTCGLCDTSQGAAGSKTMPGFPTFEGNKPS